MALSSFFNLGAPGSTPKGETSTPQVAAEESVAHLTAFNIIVSPGIGEEGQTALLFLRTQHSRRTCCSRRLH